MSVIGIDTKALEKEFDELMAQVGNYNVSPKEAEALSIKFWQGTYRVNSKLRDIRNELIAYEATSKILFTDAMKKSGAEKVTMQKALAESDENYQYAMIQHKEMLNFAEYLKHLLSIFENGHKFFKMISRD